jgi:hypothetical protein
MATSASLNQQFIIWNVIGQGASKLIAGNWRFDEDVLYYQNVPYKRHLKDAKGEHLILSKLNANTFHVQAMPNPQKLTTGKGKLLGQYALWTLPELGVFSRYHGDMSQPKQLHERMRFLFVEELRAFIDDYIRPRSVVEMERDTSQLLGIADKMYDRYFNYRMLFKTDWPPLPKMYREQIVSEIESRAKRYNDPKAVAQRERGHARKIAKKALGLDH